jgi:hypothetical protein
MNKATIFVLGTYAALAIIAGCFILSKNNDICASGYATAHRMSYADSSRIKWQMMDKIGATNGSSYQLDHIIPLELGGSNSMSNLALEPIARASIKDQWENYYHNQYCAGKIGLKQAQEEVIRYE